MKIYKCNTGMNNGSIYSSILQGPIPIVDGTITAATDEMVMAVEATQEFLAKNIVETTEKEINLSAAEKLLDEKLKEISFFLTIDEISRLKRLRPEVQKEAVEMLRDNYFEVLEHYEATGEKGAEDEDTEELNSLNTPPATGKVVETGEEVETGEKDVKDEIVEDKPEFDLINVKTLKDILTEKGIEIPKDALKAELYALAFPG